MLKANNEATFNVLQLLEMYEISTLSAESYKKSVPALLDESASDVRVKVGNYPDPALMIVSQLTLDFDSPKKAIKFIKRLAFVFESSYIYRMRKFLEAELELHYMKYGADDYHLMQLIQTGHSLATREFLAESTQYKFLHRSTSQADFLDIRFGLDDVNIDTTIGTFKLLAERTPLHRIYDYLENNPRFLIDLLENYAATEPHGLQNTARAMDYRYVVSAFTDSAKPVYIKSLDVLSVETTSAFEEALVLPFNPFAGPSSRDYLVIRTAIDLFEERFTGHFIESIRVKLVESDGVFIPVPANVNHGAISTDDTADRGVVGNKLLKRLKKEKPVPTDDAIQRVARSSNAWVDMEARLEEKQAQSDSESIESTPETVDEDNAKDHKHFNMRLDIAVDKELWKVDEHSSIVSAVSDRRYEEVNIPGEL